MALEARERTEAVAALGLFVWLSGFGKRGLAEVSRTGGA